MLFPLPKSRNEEPTRNANGQPTFQFAPPIIAHVGRFVDSNDTGNMRAGFRVARARTIRVYPAQNRIVIQIGNAACVFRLDKFFTSTLRGGMVNISRAAGARTSDRSPQEVVAQWDGFLYPEHPQSGWTFSSPDVQDPMGKGTPFDLDDRGLLYATYPVFGWGIARDDGRTNGGHFDKVAQMGFEAGDSIAVVKVRARYFAVIASQVSGGAVYDATDPASPQLVTKREQSMYAMRKYDRSDAAQRIAWIDGGNRLQVMTYAEFAGTGRPITTTIGGFVDVAFDEAGNVWGLEGDGRLWKLTPSGAGYSITTNAPFGEGFKQTRALAAGAGYVAAVGVDRGRHPFKYDVRLARITPAGHDVVDLGGFFKNYYHGGTPDHAEPGPYAIPFDLALVSHGGKIYLMYSDGGLGDAYEIAPSGAVIVAQPNVDPPRVDPPVTQPATPTGADIPALKAECERAAREIIEFASRGSVAALTPFAQAIDKLVAAARR